MLVATEREKKHMLERQIYYANKYKREHNTEMCVVWDPEGGYVGYVLRENLPFEIVYRTDAPQHPEATIDYAVGKALYDCRRGTVADVVRGTYGLGEA
jgi:hypothetical protein